MKRRKFEDDGRTIGNMNVEGFSWYRPEDNAEEKKPRPELSRSQARAAMGGILKAALLISAIFAAGYFLFLLFCDRVWFN